MQNSEYDSLATRASLLGRVRNLHDQASWQEFYDTYRPIIYGFALRAGLSPVEAEDVVQETYSALAQKMPGFEYNPANGSFKAWLFKLVRWRVVDQFRNRSPIAPPASPRPEEASCTQTIDQVPDPASLNLDQAWDEQWALQLLAIATKNVQREAEPRKFQIFDLYVNKEWPPQKVADTFGIGVDQVYLAKHRITEMIKDEIKRLENEAG
jgi:RNA polymerase sigma factor (sigma-70 family)